ncbi:Ascofuranone/ascochlorin biosynthesis clusters transcription regulator [Paramyrothecium foliicola]|nr:Ascofuranone/ascochlorin biosynthesis clusters transcription regulator [Paramyrothecium foliicola]
MASLPAGVDKPLRYACDRCHTQKLRCPRSAETTKTNLEEPCSRCRQAGVDCILSLRGKVGRPSKVAKKRPRTSSQTHADHEKWLPHAHAASGSVSSSSVRSEAGTLWAASTEDCLVDILGPTLNPDVVGTTPKGMDDVGYERTCHPGLQNLDFSSGSWAMLHGQSPKDLGTDFDFTTFYLMNNTTHGLESTLDINERTDALGEMLPDIHKTHGSSASKGSPSCAAGGSIQQSVSVATQSPGLVQPSAHGSCSMSSYKKLSDLNVRILSAFAKAETAPNPSTMLRDVIEFSGDMIQAAQEIIPYLVRSSSSSIRTSESSPANSSTVGKESDGSVDSSVSVTSGSSKWKNHVTQSRGRFVPSSAVIYLLLGCYTQILHLLEIMTTDLCVQLSDPASPEVGNEGHVITVGGLIEASISAHSINYLLGLLQRGVAVKERDGKVGQNETEYGDEDLSGQRGSFLGSTDLDCGPLGQAMSEITEREQWLAEKTQYLQRTINTYFLKLGDALQ